MTTRGKWDQHVKKTWDKNAKSWDARSEKMWDGGSRQDIIPFMKQYLSEGSSVIDIGCGSGYGTYKLYEAGFNATGTDLSSNMIELAKKHFPQEEINYFTCSMSELVNEKERYDGALVINVFEWTEDPQNELRNLHTVLNDDGYLCISIFGPTAGPRHHSYPRLRGEKVIFNTIMPWEFEQLASENGFSLVDDYGVYKQGVTDEMTEKLSKELQQALSFMWIYILQKQ
ncbi:MAG TPA: class I SAM-dependent methyltransferase [Pseudogracilibacillus sp.]|nr:class I SAM-dependent methyltransferase [Pseudogracilibacillus sp.]